MMIYLFKKVQIYHLAWKKAHTRTSSVFRSYKLSCYKELWGFALLFHCKTRCTPWLYSVLSQLYWPYNWAKRQRNNDSQMASLKACPSKLSFTCTQRVSLDLLLKETSRTVIMSLKQLLFMSLHILTHFFLFFCFVLYLLPVGWDGSLYFQNKVELAYLNKTYCISEFRKKFIFVLETDKIICVYT